MSWRILVQPEADRDLAVARDWYEQQRKGLGLEFLDEISTAMRVLEHTPQVFRLYFRNFRRLQLHRFPYKVFYQIIDGRVIVFRVLHVKQDHPATLPGL